jgi:glycosyltransferase involved in cell wall biosynthesis
VSKDIFILAPNIDNLGGTQRVFHVLAQGFGVRGHRVRLVGIERVQSPFGFDDGLAYEKTILYRERRGRRDTPAVLLADARKRLTELFAQAETGYLILGTPWSVKWASAVPAPHLSRIGQYHSSYEHAKFSSPSHLELIRRLYPNLAKSVFLSEDDARSFSRHRVPNARAIGNPLTFEPECVATPGQSRRIVTVGRLATIKRYDLLIAAFARASGEVPERWELHLVGDGYEEEQLRACAAEHGVTDRVIFQGRCKDVHSHYRDAAIFALSSEHEGHPMALAEAAALGLPAVAFGVSGGVKNLVADGASGLLAPPGDVGAFADALVRLMRAPELRARMGSTACDHVREFSLEKILDKWDSLFAEIRR